MKPIKNHSFCIGSKKKKMLFQSKSKAENFIKFNSAEIEEQKGKSPTRSYYCSFCCGWHVTSISENEKGLERDKRDEILWKKIEGKNKITKEEKLNNEIIPVNTGVKRSTFPKSEKGMILKGIADKIDRVINDIDIAFCSSDTQRLCYRFSELMELERELKTKGKEFSIDVKSMDKRYIKIEKVKNKFFYIFDYLIDENKRKLYLNSLSEEEFSKEENMIIFNIELIHQINSYLNDIDVGTLDIQERKKYREICENILNEKIPQLRGSTKTLKNNLRYKISTILSYL